MKRNFVSFVVALALAGFMCGCGAPKPSATLVAKDGAYNWTPQGLIDGLNDCMEETGDSRYFMIPDYESSGKRIKVMSEKRYATDNINLELWENEEGYLNKIVVHWYDMAPSAEAEKTYGFIIGVLVNSISPGEEQNRVLVALDMNASGSVEYTTSVISNGTKYTYEYISLGMYRDLTIEPAE